MPAMYRLLILALVLSAGGCARLALMQSDDPLADMQAARDAGDFERALYFIDHVDPDHPQYQALQKALPELQSDIRAFELKHVRKAESAMARDEWSLAYSILEDAMSQWRASQPLLQAHERVRRAERRRRNEIHGGLLLGEARWRLEQDALAGQLQALTDSASRRRYRHWVDRRHRIAEELAQLAEYFGEREDWDRVRDYLATARSLVPETGDKELLSQARRKLAAAAREYRMTRERKQLEEARTLLSRYESTLQLPDLLAVRKFLRHHQDNESLASMRRKVDRLSGQRFREDMERGEALYAKGQYREAYEVWKGIAPLSPDDPELNKKLERAEKVISKLRSLEGS